MFTARKSVIIIFTVLALSVGGSIYNLTQPPDSDGFAQDSYGTRAHGYRGIYETLDELGMPVKRSFTPPPFTLSKGERLALIAPSDGLIKNEPEYLRRTAKWIEQGGDAIIALKAPAAGWDYMDSTIAFDIKTSTLGNLGLPQFRLVEIIPAASADALTDDKAEKARHAREHVGAFHVANERETAVTTVTVAGNLKHLQKDIRHLRLPNEDLQVIEKTDDMPAFSTAVTVASDAGKYTLAAIIPRGKGTLTIVSDAALFTNHLLAEADNSVLAVNLLASGDERVVFDEFYHGLNVRGNPFWLLTKPHYAAVLIAVLFGLTLWIWRQATVLGPPLPERVGSRRSTAEYLDAMGALFLRAHRRKFLLQELRDSVLWALRKRLNLPPGHEKLEYIIPALEHREPEKARQLKAACHKIDQLITDKRNIHESTFTQAAQEINRCL